MSYHTIIDILYPFSVAAICFIFYVTTGFMRLKCDEQAFDDEQFGNDIRGILAGVCRFSFWLGIISVFRMFV